MAEADILAALADLRSTLDVVFNTVRAINETVSSHDEELTGIQAQLARIEQAQEHTANRVEVCIDALGAFRSAYLREHPHPDAA